MRRTHFIGTLAAGVAIAATGARARAYAVRHTEAQWRRILGNRYYILRENGTEPAFSSPLIAETRPGIYRCAGCATTLFTSRMKYDSGDGWPSFTTVLPHTTLTRMDYEIPGEPRTEVHCATCGGHLGHIFNDGPPPLHLRYCIDGLALVFVPAKVRR